METFEQSAYQATSNLDTILSVETSEGIDIEVEVAGMIPRGMALAIDLGWRTLVLTVISILLSVFGTFGGGIMLICAFLLEWFYPVYFEVMRSGQTPGKKNVGIRVVNDDMTPISWEASILRNLLRTVDFLPTLYLFGMLSLLFTRHSQRLGDLAAGTLVVYAEADLQNMTLPEVEPVMPPVGLTQQDRMALVDFVSRHQELSTPRQQELAGLLFNGSHDKSAHHKSAHNKSIGAEEQLALTQGVGMWVAGKTE